MDKKSTSGAKKDECTELRNMKYKSMLMNGNYNAVKHDRMSAAASNAAIDDILEKEKNQSKSEPWSKLDKTAKVGKLREFAEQYGENEHLSGEDVQNLTDFLLNNLEQKKLLRAKDVIYDKVTGCVTGIPCLVYNSLQKKFTMKRCEKRQSTLKSLAPTVSSRKTAAMTSPVGSIDEGATMVTGTVAGHGSSSAVAAGAALIKKKRNVVNKQPKIIIEDGDNE